MPANDDNPQIMSRPSITPQFDHQEQQQQHTMEKSDITLITKMPPNEKGDEEKNDDNNIEKENTTKLQNANESMKWCWCGLRSIHKFWKYFHNYWPRTYSIIFGVIIPLFLIVGISMWFGHLLARLEADNEIVSNNAAIAAKKKIVMFSSKVANITAHVPLFCLDAYFNRNKTIPTEEDVRSQIDKILDSADGIVDLELPKRARKFFKNNSGNKTVQLIKMGEFMATCGIEVKTVTTMILNSTFGIIIDEGGIGDVSFNWIRCENPNNNETSNPTLETFSKFFPGVYRDEINELQHQNLYVEQAWIQNQEELYEEYFNELYDPTDNETRGRAEFDALYYSIGNATGFDYCNANYAAAGWFWFTVMTTIGYGNTAPVSEGGRAMVFTLGFLSIIIFATLLRRAGVVVTSLFDDIVSRCSITHKIFKSVIGVQLTFWGLLYYLWMLVIAYYYKSWKESRLGEPFELGDAYWFSYITSTTVGLGDFYLDHAVFLEDDFFIFSFLFLIGFVLLANFLVKLSDLVRVVVPDKLETLDHRLQTTNVLMCGCSSSSSSSETNNDKNNANKDSKDSDEEDNSSSVSRGNKNDDDDDEKNNATLVAIVETSVANEEIMET